LAGLLFSYLWINASEIPEVLQAIQASYQASGSHIVDLWTNHSQPESRFLTSAQLAVGTSTRSATILLRNLNIDQNLRVGHRRLASSSSTCSGLPAMHAPKSLAKAAISSPVAGCSGSTRTTRLSTATQLVSATSCLSSTSSQLRPATSSTTTLRVTLLHLSSPFKAISLQRSKNTPRAAIEATTTQLHQIASFTHVSTPHKPITSGLPRAPVRSTLRRFSPCTFRLHRFARLPLRLRPSWATGMTIGPLRSISIVSHRRSAACPLLWAPSLVGVEFGSFKSSTGSGGAPSKLLYTTFIDDSQRVVAAVPFRAPKPLNMLPGWWC